MIAGHVHAGQGELLSLDAVIPAESRVEDGVRFAVDASTAAGKLVDDDAGAVALALELARACDFASAGRDARGVATAGRELRALLERLGLDPASRAVPATDPTAVFLASLGATDAS